METESDWQSHYVKLSDNNCSEKKSTFSRITIQCNSNDMQGWRIVTYFGCCLADFGPRLPTNQLNNNQNMSVSVSSADKQCT